MISWSQMLKTTPIGARDQGTFRLHATGTSPSQEFFAEMLARNEAYRRRWGYLTLCSVLRKERIRVAILVEKACKLGLVLEYARVRTGR